MAEGTITRKDIITDDALRWGDEYAKILNEAIAKNREFVDSIILLNAENIKLRKSENQTEFIKQKNEIRLISEKTILTLKEEQIAETNLEKIKQEGLKTEKLRLDIENKKQAASKASIKLSVEERLANEQNNRIAKEQAILSSKMTTDYTKLNLQRTIAKRNLLDLLSAENQNTEAIKKAEIEFTKLDVRVRKADQAVGDFHKSVGNYPKIANLTNGIKNLMGAFGVLGGIAAFAGIMKGAYDEMKIFEQGVADLSAITGATGKDLDFLKNKAIELGIGTKGGAVAVIEAYKLIASAKPELLENVAALNQVTEAVLTLSKASGMEMPAAAIALTDAMNQFNAPAEQAGIFIDALANGAKYGSAEIPQVTEALLKFGAVAKSTNVNIQESTALIELLAENGLKGADAGTALRNVLLKLSAPDALPKRAKEEFDRLGISLETLKDKSIPIQQKLELLKPLLKDNASVVKIFGLENATAAINVLSHTDRLKELTSKMYENGTAADQAAIRTDTLQGDTDKLISTYDSLILSMNKGSGPVTAFFRFFVDGARGALAGLIKLNSTVDELGAGARGKGADYALKVFNIDKTTAELEANRDKIAQEMNKTRVLIDKLRKEFDGRSAFSFLNPFAKGTSAAKKELTGLYNTLGQYEGAYKKIQGKLNPAKPGTPKAGVTDTGGGDITLTDAENAKAKAAREKALKDRLDAEKKLSDSLYELQKQQLERDIKLNEDIAKDEIQNDDLRIEALKVSNQKQRDLVDLTQQHSLDADNFVLEKDKMNANQKVLINKDAAFKIVDINKKTSEEIDKINEFDAKSYEDNIKRGIAVIEIANNEEIAAENDRYNQLKELGFKNDKAKEKAAEDHERILFNIKKEGLVAQTRLQIATLSSEIDAYEAQSDGSQKSQDFILEKRRQVAELSAKLTQAEGDKFKENETEKADSGAQRLADWYGENEKTINDIADISMQSLGQLADLSNAFSESKIAKIDDEINKNNEKYNKEIEAAGNNDNLKKELEKKRDKENEVLEKKKRIAQHKQAVFDKAVTIAQIAIQTALAVMKAAPAIPLMVMAGIAGAISLATAIATPIPKYKDGRKGGPAELAEVGDGFVHEVITNSRGMNPRLTPNIPTLTHLEQGDIVHKSLADYQDYMRASILSGLQMDSRRMNDFQAMQNNDLYGKELLEELRRTTQAVKGQKNGTIINIPGLDLNHHFWKKGNTNWN